MRLTALLLSALVAPHNVVAFAPASSSFVMPARVSTAQTPLRPTPTASSRNMMDPSSVADACSSFFPTVGSNQLLSFTDQGQNLAGIFFQSSLLPYLFFLYFLGFRGNRIPALGNFGFQFILFFVLATIPSGIISRSYYGYSLADVDYLHGGAELLLTVSTLLICLGFKGASTGKPLQPNKGRYVAFGIGAAFGALCVFGPSLGLTGHAPFLFGIGDLPTDTVLSLPWVVHTEPENALSIPTWAIHFSSVFEYLFAMQLIWDYAEITDNPKWKGLTWGMLPLHASGICACTYHFFYNPSALQFLVSMQAGFTLLGNLTCAIAAYRIAKSNGWTLEEVNPFPKSSTDPAGLMIDATAALPLVTVESKQSNTQLALTLAAVTVGTSYLVKYGELGLDLPFTPNPAVALAMVLGIPALTAAVYYNDSKQESGEGFSLLGSIPGFGAKDGEEGGGLSMQDVKKYGVAGTLAYVLTELAFWAVAFPVASTALYQSTGHWPDVIHDTTDRTTVLGFIFAGANIARLLVPLRLGAALALAPWVDENVISRLSSQDDDKVKSSASVELEEKENRLKVYDLDVVEK